MRVLLSNNTLAHRAGTELYVRDVAIELLRRGHQPVVYSTHLGEIAEEIRNATVPVVSSLKALGAAPDVVHAQHNYESVAAMVQFPQVPAVSFCHGWFPWEEKPLRFPQVRRYVAVSEVCRERLVAEEGIAPSVVELIPNFFDARLFPPRGPLSRSPRLAVSFNNEIDEDSGLSLLRRTCERWGIRLEAIGRAAGHSERRPGEALGKYDIAFARGRCAIEAMAVGAAVILCDVNRLGPMVTSANFSKLHSMNFALRALTEPFTEAGLIEAIRAYEPADAEAVSTMVRHKCELRPVVDRILAVYEDAIEEAHRQGPIPDGECNRAVVRYLEESAQYYKPSRWVEKSLEWTRAESQLKNEIASLRASASWRWSQRVLQNRLVRIALGGVIQRVARSSRRRTDSPEESR